MMRSKLWFIFVVLAVLLIFSEVDLQAFVTHQDVTVASSPNPVGSGARAVGMGGAFIAVADDATAASWNPAGLVQLERPELSIVGAYVSRSADYSSSSDPVVNNSTETDQSDLNYFSATYPFSFLNRNMVVSINYQRLYDFKFNVHYRFERIEQLSFPFESLTRSQDIDYSQDGNLGPLGLAYAVEITPRLSFGLTLNIWRDDLLGRQNGWEETYRAHIEDVLRDVFGGITINTMDVHLVDEYYDFSGENANFGMLWDMNKYLTIGAVIKIPFTATIRHRHTRADLPSENYEEEVKLRMPTSYGIGIACRFSDEFTVDLDVYRTDWSDYTLTDGQGNEFSPINGRPKSESNIKDTTQVRIGGEYLFIQEKRNLVVPLRAGFFYDPEPGDGKVENFYGFTIGSGIGYKRFIFDMAYQLRWGHNVDASNVVNTTSADAKADVTQHLILASVIYHF
jgi:long-subunit fatty acid transport protein